MTNFSTEIKKLMKLKGIDAVKLAGMVNRPHGTVKGWCNGRGCISYADLQTVKYQLQLSDATYAALLSAAQADQIHIWKNK